VTAIGYRLSAIGLSMRLHRTLMAEKRDGYRLSAIGLSMRLHRTLMAEKRDDYRLSAIGYQLVTFANKARTPLPRT
jgi:hypothetical protein